MANPKFQDLLTWQQAELLMQPTFIRLIDNLRKQLEQSSWKGTYEDVPVWSDTVTDDVRLRVMQLQAELQTASAEAAITIESALAELPSPSSSYQLHLQRHEQSIILDVWSLCYKICFQNYDAASGTSHAPEPIGSSQGVKIDASLFDETGEVDWDRLDHKAKQVVQELFAGLPIS